MHTDFEALLTKYNADARIHKIIAYQIKHLFEQMNKESIEAEKALKEKLAEVTKRSPLLKRSTMCCKK